MPLSQGDVERIAHLARLGIDAEAVPHYAENLSAILNLVDQLNQADTTDVAPMAHPLHMQQRLRADKVTEENLREILQADAPATDEGCFLVPRVIE